MSSKFKTGNENMPKTGDNRVLLSKPKGVGCRPFLLPYDHAVKTQISDSSVRETVSEYQGYLVIG